LKFEQKVKFESEISLICVSEKIWRYSNVSALRYIDEGLIISWNFNNYFLFYLSNYRLRILRTVISLRLLIALNTHYKYLDWWYEKRENKFNENSSKILRKVKIKIFFNKVILHLIEYACKTHRKYSFYFRIE